MDFDETRLYFSHQQLQRKDNPNDDGGGRTAGGGGDDLDIDDDNAVDLKAVRRHFREFLSKSRDMVPVEPVVVLAVVPWKLIFSVLMTLRKLPLGGAAIYLS
jgi:hypothetical protein